MNWKQTFYQLRNTEKGREKRSEGSYVEELLGPHLFLSGQMDATKPLHPNLASDKKDTEIGKVMQSLDEFVKTKGAVSKEDRSKKEVVVSQVKFRSQVNSSLEVVFEFGPTACRDLSALKLRLEGCSQCPHEAIEKRGLVAHELAGLEAPLDVLFVGQAPTSGKKLGETSNPCAAGDAGELLRKMIGAMKLPAGKVGITLLRKCFTAKEEEFSDEMLANCREHFISELAVLRPKVVITLGAVTTNTLLKQKQRLSNVHGVFHSGILKDSGEELHNFKIVPLFHPEFLLINPKMKRTAWVDLQKVMAYLEN